MGRGVGCGLITITYTGRIHLKGVLFQSTVVWQSGVFPYVEMFEKVEKPVV